MNEMFDFRYYRPINEKQAAFHASKARHKLLMGGVGAGKTMPAIHEAFFICANNPGCEFVVFKNTWDSLNENIEKDMLKISENANCHPPHGYEKTKHILTLHNKCAIKFRPLTIKDSEAKGMHLCGFLIDDPNVRRFQKMIGFLFTRLRNPPHVKANYFETIMCANWEGKDWAWQKYMRGREPGGDGATAYWVIRTDENPELPKHYIEDMAAMHSEAWMKRYVFCDPDSAYSGLVYEEYDPKYHDMDLSWCFKKPDLVKIMVVDVGLGVSCVYKMATDGKNLYIYDEWYKHDARLESVGEYIQRELKKDNFRTVVIDPSSAKGEQTSYTNAKAELTKNYGIQFTDGINTKQYGIEVVKGLMTVRQDVTHLFVDPQRCPWWKREVEVYRWKEPLLSEFDEFSFKEEPVDKDDHGMDCTKYGGQYLKKFMKRLTGRDSLLKLRRQKMWQTRLRKLKIYQENPSMRVNQEADKIRRIHKAGLRKGWNMQIARLREQGKIEQNRKAVINA